MLAAGEGVFGNMQLMFAVGVAQGCQKAMTVPLRSQA